MCRGKKSLVTSISVHETLAVYLFNVQSPFTIDISTLTRIEERFVLCRRVQVFFFVFSKYSSRQVRVSRALYFLSNNVIASFYRTFTKSLQVHRLYGENLEANLTRIKSQRAHLPSTGFLGSFRCWLKSSIFESEISSQGFH